MGVAGVEQALGVGHHCPVDLEQVGKEDAQHTGDQDAKKGAGYRRPAPPVKAVHQSDDQNGEKEGDGQPAPDGVPALEVEGDQELPQAEHRQYEGGDGTHPGAPSEQDEEEGKAGGHQGLPAQAVVVAHGDIGDGVPVVAHHHLGPVPGREELVLLQRAVEHVDPGDRPSLKSAVQDLKLAALLTRADQAGVDDGGVVCLQHPGGAALCLLVDQGALKASGQDQKEQDGQQAYQHRSLVGKRMGSEAVEHG